jgi:hypothetical protein
VARATIIEVEAGLPPPTIQAPSIHANAEETLGILDARDYCDRRERYCRHRPVRAFPNSIRLQPVGCVVQDGFNALKTSIEVMDALAVRAL